MRNVNSLGLRVPFGRADQFAVFLAQPCALPLELDARQLWRQRAAEQIAAEIAAIPPLIPPYWQGFATATGLAVVGYVLQAIFS